MPMTAALLSLGTPVNLPSYNHLLRLTEGKPYFKNFQYN